MSEQTQTQTQSHQTTLDSIEQSNVVSDAAIYHEAETAMLDKVVHATVKVGDRKYKVGASISEVNNLHLIAAIPLID